MRTHLGALVATLILIPWAGCVSEADASKTQESPTDPAPEPTVTADTGSISGLVVSNELAPLSGAIVGLLERPELAATTDEGGRFTFNDVEPGGYSVVAQKLGYDSAARKITVVAGEVAEVEFVLKPIPTDEPYVESFTYAGFFGLGFSTPVVTARLGGVISPSTERSIFRTNLSGPGLEDVVDAMTGESSAPLTAKRFMLVLSAVNGGSGSNTTAGTSPLLNKLEGPKTNQTSQISHVTWIAWTQTSDPTQVVVVVFQQRFTLHANLFYHDPAPPDFTGLP